PLAQLAQDARLRHPGGNTPMKPQVTIITPTLPNRHGKLQAACKSNQNQTFREWTHLIIPNGYDGQMDQTLRQIGHFNSRVRVQALGRPHPTPGHWNRLLGGLLAQTPYIAYLDDDNLWRPQHLKILVDLLDSNPGIGFAYSQLKCGERVLGDGKISPGNTVTNIDVSQVVHRAELLIEVATWDP